MKILDEIKAKREAATLGKWFSSAGEIFTTEKTVFYDPKARRTDSVYIARMDPRTVEAMENVIRAAINANSKFLPGGIKMVRSEDMDLLSEALEALERVDELEAGEGRGE